MDIVEETKNAFRVSFFKISDSAVSGGPELQSRKQDRVQNPDPFLLNVLWARCEPLNPRRSHVTAP